MFEILDYTLTSMSNESTTPYNQIMGNDDERTQRHLLELSNLVKEFCKSGQETAQEKNVIESFSRLMLHRSMPKAKGKLQIKNYNLN